MAYDDPDYSIRRESAHITTAGATTEGAKFRLFQAARLKKVHAAVITAGTATTHGYDVYHGTTSIGTIALSTSAAGVTASSALLDRAIGSMTQMSVKSLADATGVAHIIYEYEITPDAVQS
ncbi:hypothetical protein [Aromatoleum anaerobium]|uniref:Uncharacterized protein n=1 Tax=Aromatoleum anaerobium TaxID=182180 RepID=A0ABX1PPS8_9RHOO|nr:hypothetical protein [Aromatoleum anaerobium]MCK0507910.1 hypothetical protein [Aromatoleum anaerobium]